MTKKNPKMLKIAARLKFFKSDMGLNDCISWIVTDVPPKPKNAITVPKKEFAIAGANPNINADMTPPKNNNNIPK